MKEEVKRGLSEMRKKKKIVLYDDTPNHIRCVKKRTDSFCLHWHNFYEFELVLSGSGKHILNGKEYPLQRGSCWLTRLSDVHEGIVSDTANVYNVQFAPSRMPEEMLHRLSLSSDNFIVSFSKKEFLIANELFKALFRLKDDKTKEGEEVSEYILSALLALFFRTYGSGGSKETSSPLRIAETLSFIAENFRTRISLYDIAEALHTNKNYLCTYFKEKMGVSVMTYIRDMRLEYAVRLLKTTELRGIDIATECGYGSISHFLRDFKTKFGTTPKEMRSSFEAEEKKKGKENA